MNHLSSKMTRRKQNTPKRLKSTDKVENGSVSCQSLNSSHVTTESGTGDGDEEEEEGDSSSDEEITADKNAEAKLEADTVNHMLARSGSEAASTHPADSSCHKTQSSQELNFGSNSKDECSEPYREVKQCGEKIRKASPLKSSEVEILSPSLVESRTETWSSKTAAGVSSDKYRYSYKLTPPSSAITLTGLDPQMALVMSSMPLSLLSSGSNSPSQQKSAVSYSSMSNSCPRDEQPLDLSKKSEKSPSLSSPKESISVLKNCASTSVSTATIATTISNGFSSLQSLQRRFGGEYPLELTSQQPGLIHKSAVAPHALPMSSDALQRSGVSKAKSGLRCDRLEKQEATRALTSSPVLKGNSSRHTSPMLADEPVTEVGGKHTIHRCSCQKTFSTLYTLSLHLQETGHTPSSSKTASPMDYPKLVRGQDMWLNQESEQTRRILRCMQCGESFRSLPLLTVHMMQTQHYTKIVSSDHGRRSHKCSTYCDRELDRECIFKCKVCHEAFTDMEGLANHMIVSGHHKKQSSRQVPNPAAFSADISCIARQGRRKRFLPADIASVSETNPSTVASLLEHRRKQMENGHNEVNGFRSDSKNGRENRSPEERGRRLVLCDSCGGHVESRDFDSHVRGCLRQRAEVIDALKNKLAIEEALLSRSESKLLRSGISLSPTSDHGKYLFTSSASRAKSSSGQVHKSQYGKINEEDDICYPSQVKSEVSSPERDQNCASAEPKPLPKNSECSTKICDLIEVPLRKWYCSGEEHSHYDSREDNGNTDKKNDSSQSVKMSQIQATERGQTVDKIIKKEDVNEEMHQKSKSVSSPGVGEKRKLPDLDTSWDSFTCMRKKDRLSPDLVQESREESLDFTSSALHKLDMFSRGLKFSPPRRNITPESNLLHHHHHSARVSKKRETALFTTKSPQPVSASPLSQLKTHSPEPPKQDVTFDIIDPNAESENGESSASALEAMESFIHKSFSAKSDICSSNLASMFSPFRNCFPLPGSLPGQSGVPNDSSDRALSHFAKFTKFFRMVPGAAVLSDAPSAPLLECSNLGGAPSPSLSESQHGTFHDKTDLPKKISAKPHISSSTIKVPLVNFQSELPLGTCSINTHKLSSGKRVDAVHTTKKYKYSSGSSLSSVLDCVRNHAHSQRSSQSSGNIGVHSDGQESNKVDSFLHMHSDVDTSATEPKRKRLDGHDISDIICSKNDKDEDSKNECIDIINKSSSIRESSFLDDENQKCNEKYEESLLCSHEQKQDSADSLVQPRATCLQEAHVSSAVQVSGVDEDRSGVTTSAEDSKKLFPDSPPQSVNSESKDEEVGKIIPAEDDSSNNRESCCESSSGGKDESLLGVKNNDWCEDTVFVQVKSRDTVVKSPASSHQKTSERKKSDSGKTSQKSVESDSLNCDGDVDTNDDDGDDDDNNDDEDNCSHRCVSQRSNKEMRTRDTEAEALNMNNVIQDNNHKVHGTQYMVAVNVQESDEGVDNCDDSNEKHCSRHCREAERSSEMVFSVRNQVGSQDGAAADGSLKHEIRNTLDEEEGGEEEEEEEEEESRSESQQCCVSTALKSPVVDTKPTSSICEHLHLLRAAQSGNTEALTGLQSDCIGSKSSDLPELLPEKKAALTQHVDKNLEEIDRQKKSALDSLSSFVYSQPLTSEHPLDCLHRLLSTNDLSHLQSDPHKFSPATSYKCVTPDLTMPLNLTSKGGGGMSSRGSSSDENEEGDPVAIEGGAVEGDVREYKCAACNRRFASKGSYRYHLSRCHLSSVKKYGIKEAFNMSPYVYLPLDHTAKFSKYYQMAHELANKGK